MTLSKAWYELRNASQDAIDWINQVSPNVKRLANESSSLNLEFRRLKNTARRLGEISEKSVAVGFFGLSQAGKSYLISSLAADNQGKLKTKFDGQELDFIEHINPPGGGKEATGLVTRFTRDIKPAVANYPLELRLFEEIEVAKILVNSYFNDFDKERVTYQLEIERINLLLNELQHKCETNVIAGVSADDVVDLQDYAHDNFDKSLASLKGDYWHKATEIAPFLTVENRAKLFSILWAEIPELTNIYIQFAQTLTRLNFAKRVYAPLTAVVKDDNGVLVQTDSIMNVDMLERLNSPLDSTLEVCPLNADGSIGSAVKVSLAELTALTAEMVFPLINPTRVEAIEKVDLLDFPGYRGRLAITSLAEVKEGNPISQLILRGKVAYLFERYTDSQEMNILIVCTPSTKQSDVNSVGPVLERWIHKTQGITPQERAKRKIGLLWAITMFDMRISQDLDKPEGMLKYTWGQGGLLKQTILERFGNYDWLSNWANDKAFNNVFLVRKPGFKVAFLDMEGDNELAFNPQYVKQMQVLKNTFCADMDVEKYIATPDIAWDAMLNLNDGGMDRISQYLENIALPEIKSQRLIEQLNQAIDHVTKNSFASWYQQDGEGEFNQKKEISIKISMALQQNGWMVGELLHSLQLPKETIRSLYLSNSDVQIQESEQENLDDSLNTNFGFGTTFDLFSDDSVVLNDAPDHESKAIASFSEKVFSAWISHLRELSQQTSLLQFLNLPADILDKLTTELITGANRLKLQQQLFDIEKRNELAGNRREELVERQVFSMFTLISDFIAWLGNDRVPITQRVKNKTFKDKPVFEPKELVNNLPNLIDDADNYTQHYVYDWIVAFMQFATDNAGHSAGREISADQNANLGVILSHFEQARIK